MSEMVSSFHSEDDLIAVKSMQDVEPVLNECKNRRDMGLVGSNEMRHAASFPMAIVETYLNKMKISFEEFIRNPVHAKNMLNDHDLRAFRVWEGVA